VAPGDGPGVGGHTGITVLDPTRLAHGQRTRRTFAVATGALSCVVGVAWAAPLLG